MSGNLGGGGQEFLSVTGHDLLVRLDQVESPHSFDHSRLGFDFGILAGTFSRIFFDSRFGAKGVGNALKENASALRSAIYSWRMQ